MALRRPLNGCTIVQCDSGPCRAIPVRFWQGFSTFLLETLLAPLWELTVWLADVWQGNQWAVALCAWGPGCSSFGWARSVHVHGQASADAAFALDQGPLFFFARTE